MMDCDVETFEAAPEGVGSLVFKGKADRKHIW